MPGGNKEGGGLEVKSAYKMKGSPFQRNFGISPMKQKEKSGLNIKKIAKKIYNAPGQAAIDLWHKYGPVINPSTKNPKGLSKNTKK